MPRKVGFLMFPCLSRAEIVEVLNEISDFSVNNLDKSLMLPASFHIKQSNVKSFNAMDRVRYF